MSKEAMKLALEALECTEYPQDHYDAITALREALEEQPAQCAPAADGVCEALDCSNHKPAPVQQIAESPDDWSDWKVKAAADQLEIEMDRAIQDWSNT